MGLIIRLDKIRSDLVFVTTMKIDVWRMFNLFFWPNINWAQGEVAGGPAEVEMSKFCITTRLMAAL